MSSQVVKVFLLLCLLQLSERLVLSGTIPPVTSLETKLPGGETKPPGSGEPLAVTGTTPTPPGKEGTGNPETKPPGGKTDGPDSLLVTGNTVAPETKLPGGETKASGAGGELPVTTPQAKEHTGNPETKSPGGPDSLIIITEAPGTKAPGGDPKVTGTEKILHVTGTTPQDKENTGKPTTKSPGGNSKGPDSLVITEAPGTKSPGGNTEAPVTGGQETGAPVTKPK